MVAHTEFKASLSLTYTSVTLKCQALFYAGKVGLKSVAVAVRERATLHMQEVEQEYQEWGVEPAEMAEGTFH